MSALPRTSRQLPLWLDATPAAADIVPVTIPAALAADVIDALATLLLDAADITSDMTEGGTHEFEDHA